MEFVPLVPSIWQFVPLDHPVWEFDTVWASMVTGASIKFETSIFEILPSAYLKERQFLLVGKKKKW